MIRCPICKKEVPPGGADFPFCSERCRLLDLGNWASEKYAISTPLKPGELPKNDDDEPEE
jgi:endogenous inhibitor of DNA gyrase (YacG/DUF329 family)